MKMTQHEMLFKENEIVIYSQWDERRQQESQTQFPRIGGRLRLAHDLNESLSISTEIVKFEADMAVVIAHTTTEKGSFSGTGTASTMRDQGIALAILELAETRAIARSLRFAGYGMEFCSAEEVSQLDSHEPSAMNGEKTPPTSGTQHVPDVEQKISPRQLDFIMALGKKKNLNIQLMEKMSCDLHGVRIGNLLKTEASELIDHILTYKDSREMNTA